VQLSKLEPKRKEGFQTPWCRTGMGTDVTLSTLCT
jgi:hypothetical protein